MPVRVVSKQRVVVRFTCDVPVGTYHRLTEEIKHANGMGTIPRARTVYLNHAKLVRSLMGSWMRKEIPR